MKERVSKLLTVKSIVTIITTLVFAYLAITHQIDNNFLTIYAVIIAFYFGTQSNKATETATSEVNTDETQNK